MSVVSVIIVFVVAPLLFGWWVEATTYEVGDGLNWVQPPTLTTYTLWASSHLFVKGDVLVFNFNNGIHNVAEVTKEAYEKCNKSSPISIHNQSPVRIPLPNRAKRYFISTLTNDCENGLKLAIKVLSHLPPAAPPRQPPSISPAAATPGVTNQVSASPSTAPTSTSTLPGPPPPPPPPPRNSAPSSFGYASLFGIVAVGLLCVFGF